MTTLFNCRERNNVKIGEQVCIFKLHKSKHIKWNKNMSHSFGVQATDYVAKMFQEKNTIVVEIPKCTIAFLCTISSDLNLI